MIFQMEYAIVFLRICIWLILQSSPGNFYCLLAIVCSSWVPVNLATSKRSIAYPDGNTSRAYVAEANSMCARLLDLWYCFYCKWKVSIDVRHMSAESAVYGSAIYMHIMWISFCFDSWVWCCWQFWSLLVVEHFWLSNLVVHTWNSMTKWNGSIVKFL